MTAKNVPAGAKRPADRLPAAKGEAMGARPDTVTVNIYDRDYEVAPDFFDDLEVLEALEEGHIVQVLKSLFGDDYRTLVEDIKAAHDGRAPLSALDGVFEKLTAEVGPTDSR